MKKIIKWTLIVFVAGFVFLVLVGIFAGDNNEVEDGKQIETETEEAAKRNMDMGQENVSEEKSAEEESEESNLPNAETALEYADFNVYDTEGYGLNAISNLVEYYQVYDSEEGMNGYIYYYDPVTDASKKGIVVTQRDIQTGDKQSTVIKAYGKGKSGQVADDNWLFDGLEESVKKVLRETCVTYRIYNAEGIGTITFYFDSEDELTCVLYTIDEDYGNIIEVTEDEIKALYGTYIKEDKEYELAVESDGSGGVCIDITKSGENVFHCSTAIVESTRALGSETIFAGIKICAEDDDTCDKRLVIDVGTDGSLLISDPYSEYFGDYIRK